ncbi:Phosphatase PHOSPHO-type [Corchorus capsularis]|uniref:Phosphatase PHOSPHO-type n=1 Tax=Corchorus capsularis TaxID=210143 RepID=A0A1R3HKC6_COCAP|nr:Phosphatase PHOSPHO-type [Corchorus capsularis]
MAGIVVIFDFDKTIIDCDSDNWVLDELGATELFNQLLPTMAWNPLMGMVIESIKASMANDIEKKTIIYLGDGIGDCCSIVKLRDGDYAMPRKNFPVWDLICQNRGLIKAEIFEWSNGEEFEHVLLHLISKISIDKINHAQQFSVHDCRQQALLQGPGHEQGYKFRTKATKLRLVIPTQLTSFGNFNQFRPFSTKTNISTGRYY